MDNKKIKRTAAFKAKKEQQFHGAKYSQRVFKSATDYNRRRERDVSKFLNELNEEE